MAIVTLDLSKPFYLVEIYDKSTNDLKYRWCTDQLIENENINKVQPRAPLKPLNETYIIDIYVDSRLETPTNSCEVKILNDFNQTLELEIGDKIKIYFGYCKKGGSLEPMFSLGYTGKVSELETKFNVVIIKGISAIHKLTTQTLTQSFSKIMSIDEIIKKLATYYGKLKLAKDGIGVTSISKQKGFAISKQMSVYEHIERLAEFAGFVVYMDVDDKFNAKPWQPANLKGSSHDNDKTDPSQIWITERDETEHDFTMQYLHRYQCGTTITDLELNKPEPLNAEIEVMNFQDFSSDQYTYSISPTSSCSRFENGQAKLLKFGNINTKSSGTKYILPGISTGDLQKIARNIYSKKHHGIIGRIEVIGAPQIRLGDGIKLENECFEMLSRNDTIFQVIEIEHIYNMNEGFISRIGIQEYISASSKSDVGNTDNLIRSSLTKLM